MSETIEKFNKHVMQTYGRLPIVLEKGHNDDAVDENGKEYIDFGSGIGTNSLGYCNDKWADAVCAQARAIQHTSNYFYTKVQADFAAKLCELTGYTDVFFGNSGAEAKFSLQTPVRRRMRAPSSSRENIPSINTARADTPSLPL